MQNLVRINRNKSFTAADIVLTDIHIDSLHSFLWIFAEHDNITNNSVRNFEQFQFLIRRSLYGQIRHFVIVI